MKNQVKRNCLATSHPQPVKMNPNYRSFRLIVVNLSYFYLLELILTKNFYPGVPQGIEYLTWLAVGLLIFILAWLITNSRRAEISAGLWLSALYFMLWLELHMPEMSGLGLRKIILILGPCLLVLVIFLLWLGGIILERFQNLKNEMMLSALLTFPIWLLVFRQGIGHQLFKMESAFGHAIFFALTIASALIVGWLLSFMSSIRIFSLSRLWLILVLPTAFFALFGPIQSQIQQKKTRLTAEKNLPDLILISVDTLRQDHIGVYSANAFHTPNFDNLAQDSIIFENAISPSNWTLPAIASWLTGKYPHQHQSGKLLWSISSNLPSFTPMDPKIPTLAQELKKKGYYTVAFLDNAWLKGLGVPQGFDYYFLYFPPQLGKNLMGLKLVKAFYYLFTRGFQDQGASWLTNQAIRWLKKNQNRKPIFLWVHYYDPHLPYRAHQKQLPAEKANPVVAKFSQRLYPELIRAGYYNLSQANKQLIHQLYIGEVIYTDHHFGRLLQELKNQNRYLDSVIIFTSDHGEEFWEHGSFEHGHTFFQELIKVPLLVKLPQNRNAGQRVSAPVSTIQIYSTFLKFAELSSDAPPDLLKVMNDPSQSPEILLSEATLYFDLKGAGIDRNLKKIILGPASEKTAFDLTVDPLEKNPLPLEQIPPALLNLDIPAPSLGIGSDSLSSEMRKNLEALGYLK